VCRVYGLLNRKQLERIEFVGNWYQIDYMKLIKKAQQANKEQSRIKQKDAWVKIGNLLEKNGFLKYMISDKMLFDLCRLPITEKFIENAIGDKYTDKPKKTFRNTQSKNKKK